MVEDAEVQIRGLVLALPSLETVSSATDPPGSLDRCGDEDFTNVARHEICEKEEVLLRFSRHIEKDEPLGAQDARNLALEVVTAAP